MFRLFKKKQTKTKQLPNILFDHNFVCFIRFWRVSDVTNPLFCCLHPDTVLWWKALFSSNIARFVIVNLLCYSSLHEVIRPYSLLASTDVHQESFQRYDTNIEVSKRRSRPCMLPRSYFKMRGLCSLFCCDCLSAMNLKKFFGFFF